MQVDVFLLLYIEKIKGIDKNLQIGYVVSNMLVINCVE